MRQAEPRPAAFPALYVIRISWLIYCHLSQSAPPQTTARPIAATVDKSRYFGAGKKIAIIVGWNSPDHEYKVL